MAILSNGELSHRWACQMVNLPSGEPAAVGSLSNGDPVPMVVHPRLPRPVAGIPTHWRTFPMLSLPNGEHVPMVSFTIGVSAPMISLHYGARAPIVNLPNCACSILGCAHHWESYTALRGRVYGACRKRVDLGRCRPRVSRHVEGHV